MLEKFNPFKAIVVSAGIVVIIAGLIAAKSIVIPLLLAGFIAIITAPLLFWLQSKGLNRALALIIVLILISLAFFATSYIIGSSIGSFSKELPLYEAKLSMQLKDSFSALEPLGITLSSESLNALLDPSRLMQITSVVFQGLSSLVTHGMMTLFLVVFMLLEASVLPSKLKLIHVDMMGHVSRFLTNVKHYMLLKTLFSLITGLLISILLWLLDVHYALLFGLVAFLLNFIPNIGSIIAAIPAVILALIQLGSTTALMVAIGFILINILIGSIIEPKYMGEGLGISTLVVFISLIFWGWVLGPVGMLLSIPLTVMVKIALETQEQTRWIATLLDADVTKKS